MITFITGAPGSGKTLYTIAKLLKPMLGTTVTKHNDDGTTTELPRTIYTNIKGFLFDHELIDDGAEGGLNNWHEWAKPGSIICFDEVQKPWPPRPNGAKVPDYIQHLETHRHMGVDFIVMTQHPLLVDRNLVNLVGRHLHMRRIANMALAVVYEWDHCSRSLLYRNAVTKSPWRYDKAVYKVYKSAEVHTKQPRKIPGLVWFILVGLAGFAYLGPTTFNRISDRAQGKHLVYRPRPCSRWLRPSWGSLPHLVNSSRLPPSLLGYLRPQILRLISRAALPARPSAPASMTRAAKSNRMPRCAQTWPKSGPRPWICSLIRRAWRSQIPTTSMCARSCKANGAT